jgi:hypothetical protein
MVSAASHFDAALGGLLRVRSSAAGGTRFTAVIPVDVAGEECEDASSLASPCTSSRSSRASASSRRSGAEDVTAASAPSEQIEEKNMSAGSLEGDRGMQPYLPEHAPFSDSFDAFKQRGMLRELMDLVRYRPRCALLPSVCRALRAAHCIDTLTRPCCALAAAAELARWLLRR